MSKLFTSHLTHPEQLEPIKATCLGQAHFAGTGPEGKTCRECKKWHLRDKPDHEHGYKPPEDDDPTSPERVYTLHKYHCNHRILNKALDRVPPEAPACMFFEQSPSPPPHFEDGLAAKAQGQMFGPNP